MCTNEPCKILFPAYDTKCIEIEVDKPIVIPSSCFSFFLQAVHWFPVLLAPDGMSAQLNIYGTVRSKECDEFIFPKNRGDMPHFIFQKIVEKTCQAQQCAKRYNGICLELPLIRY